MEKHYLFFCSLGYAIPILRPLQAEIEHRGGKVAWYLERTCPSDMLSENDLTLKTLHEVRAWKPIAVFAPGIYVYDFFPGVKVEVFHGYPIYKRGGTEETHFRIRGWFDIYLTAGPSSTPVFQEIEAKDGTFRCYETGWAKADAMIHALRHAPSREGQPKTVFVGTTFTRGITQLANLYPTIRHLAETRDWRWVITMHPKLEDPALRESLRQLAATRDNVAFYPDPPSPDVLAATDVMLCDASSIILEYMMLDKPVVTYRNTMPGPHLLNVERLEEVEEAIERAFTRPEDLMKAQRAYVATHEAHLDGKNCSRILDAVDDFILHHQGRLKRKPLNLFRKIKIRMKYFQLKP